MRFQIRGECADDIHAIRHVTQAAFAAAAHSSGKEAAIIETLRDSGALTLSLVAIIEDELVGHVAFSPVTLAGKDICWLGLGPVCVKPGRQGKGIGSALIREGLERVQKAGAAGCVVIGEPKYYRRFGFRNFAQLRYDGAPAEFFMAIALEGDVPAGLTAYHTAFMTC